MAVVFTQMHFMSHDALIALMCGAGFKQLHLVNSEGMCSPRERGYRSAAGAA